jgi:SAM-dependent methyltransferase
MNRIHRWLCRSAAWRRAVEDTILPWTLEGVALGDDVLEVGPGPGLTTDLVRARARRVTAVEIDGRLAAALGRRLGGTNVRVVEGDGALLPFGNATFSAALSFTMLHHVPSRAAQDRLFAEVCRVLEPGGWFAGVDSTTSLVFRLVHTGDTMVMVDPDGIGERLERAGFHQVAVDRGRGRFRFRARRPMERAA